MWSVDVKAKVEGENPAGDDEGGFRVKLANESEKKAQTNATAE